MPQLDWIIPMRGIREFPKLHCLGAISYAGKQDFRTALRRLAAVRLPIDNPAGLAVAASAVIEQDFANVPNLCEFGGPDPQVCIFGIPILVVAGGEYDAPAKHHARVAKLVFPKIQPANFGVAGGEDVVETLFAVVVDDSHVAAHNPNFRK